MGGQSRKTEKRYPSQTAEITLSSGPTLVRGNSPAVTPPLPTHLASHSPIPQSIDRPSIVPPQGEFLATGERLGRYEIIRMIGRGGMGTVYEATDTQLHRRVALKTLVGQLAGRPDAVQRFFLEAQAAGRLMHPNVVAIFDFNAESDIPFMAMELLKGEPLSTAIRKGPIPVKQVADAMLGVCAGIEAAHKVGIIHRDLKPSNIFLAVDWNGQLRPRILDFGISKIRDISSGGLTQTGDIIGTSQYLSPEHAAANRLVDARSDIYSLGVVIYETVTQRTPQQGEPVYQLLRNVIEGRWQSPNVYCPNLPPDFEAVILRAMHLSPTERYQSAFEMGRALFPFASSRVKRQFDEYYHGTGVLSLPGPEAIIAADRVGKEVDLRAAVTEVLPQNDVPDWQNQSTHTALPFTAPEPSSISQEFHFTTDSDASSPAVTIPSTHRWPWLAFIGGLGIVIGMVMLWRSDRKSPSEVPSEPKRSPPLIAPPTVATAPPIIEQPLPPTASSATENPSLPHIESPPSLTPTPKPTNSPPLTLRKSSASTASPTNRTTLVTKLGFSSRKKRKSPSAIQVKIPSSVTQPATPPLAVPLVPVREEAGANKPSIAPASNGITAEQPKPSPDRW